jgi:CubicO group peptidase (beta-lactamase class C family)
VIDSDLIARVDTLAPVAMAEAPVPGLAVALVSSTADTWIGAYGVADTSTGRPVEPRTVFEAASLTKPVVALGVLALAGAGILALDRPLDTYLAAPYLPTEKRAAVITARMVLGHTTGFPNWRPRGEPLALLRDPGTRFGYSGEGYVYLQRVVEHVTDSTLDRLCAGRVTAPLGMTDSTFIWCDDLETRVARGHDKRGAPVPKAKPARPNAAWSLHTTAPDLARFVRAMLGAPPVSTGTASAITADTTDTMLRPHTALHGSLAWGLGWGLHHGSDSDAHFWHWGDNVGYKAFAAGCRSRGLGIAVLTNGNAGLAAAERLVRAALPSLDAPFDALRDFGRYLS